MRYLWGALGAMHLTEPILSILQRPSTQPRQVNSPAGTKKPMAASMFLEFTEQSGKKGACVWVSSPNEDLMSYHFLHPIKGLAACQLHKWPLLVRTLTVKYLQTTKEEHRFEKTGQTLAHFPDPLGGLISENMDIKKLKFLNNQNAQMHLSHPFSVQLNIFGIILFKIFKL